MAADTLTIILDGEVPLGEFARTIESITPHRRIHE